MVVVVVVVELHPIVLSHRQFWDVARACQIDSLLVTLTERIPADTMLASVHIRTILRGYGCMSWCSCVHYCVLNLPGSLFVLRTHYGRVVFDHLPKPKHGSRSILNKLQVLLPMKANEFNLVGLVGKVRFESTEFSP